jgi:hypothetical protein
MRTKINEFCNKLYSFILREPIKAAFFGVGILATIMFICGLYNNSLFTGASVLLVADAMLYGIHRNILSDRQKNSQFYLTKYLEGLGMVLDRLKSDSPERRMAWVTAASIASDLKCIEEKITETPDKDFLEIYQRNFAHLLVEFIQNKPASYFYGIDDPQGLTEDESLDNAAERVMENHGVVTSGPLLKLKSHYIDEKQIAMVLKLADSIWIKKGGQACTAGNNLILDACILNYPNIYRYITHLNSCDKVYEEGRGFVFKRKKKG